MSLVPGAYTLAGRRLPTNGVARQWLVGSSILYLRLVQVEVRIETVRVRKVVQYVEVRIAIAAQTRMRCPRRVMCVGQKRKGKTKSGTWGIASMSRIVCTLMIYVISMVHGTRIQYCMRDATCISRGGWRGTVDSTTRRLLYTVFSLISPAGRSHTTHSLGYLTQRAE